jgi:uncharacterized phage-associated protein
MSLKAEKLRNAIIFFIKHDKTVKLTKLMKLLYYLDFRHYQETGYSVTGQEYAAWPKGPLPEDVWAEIRHKENRGCGIKQFLIALPAAPGIDEFGYTLKLLKGVKFSEDPFTQRELRILRDVSEIFKGVPVTQIVDATHMRGLPWETTVRKVGEKAKIDYDLAFEGVDPDDIERIREDQQDRHTLEELLGVLS